MRWPWTKERETDLLTTREGEAGWLSPADANDFEGEGQEPEPDLLDDLEPDVRAQVEERIHTAQQEAIQRTQAALRRAGYALTDQMDLAIVDPETASRFAPQPRYQEPQAARAQQQQPTAQEPEDEEVPDPITQPREFRRWLKQEQDTSLKAVVQEALLPVTQALTSVSQRQMAREMDTVIQRTPDAVQRFAPSLDYLLDHPEFERAYRQVLSQVDPAVWDDPMNLARMVGGLVTDLAMLDQQAGRQPQQARAKGQPRMPQPTPQAGFNARLAQQAAAQAGPSVGSGRGVPKSQVNEAYEEFARRMQAYTGKKYTPEEAVAFDNNPDSDQAQQMRDKRLFEPPPKKGRRR